MLIKVRLCGSAWHGSQRCVRNGGFTFWPEVKIIRLIDIFSAVFSPQFFSLEADTAKS